VNWIQKGLLKAAGINIKSIPTNADMLKKGFKGFGSNTPNWLSMNERHHYLRAYETIPELSSPINYKANLFPSVNDKLWKLNSKGQKDYVIDSHPILDLINNPNFFQDRAELMVQNNLNKSVFGDSFLWFKYPAGFEKASYERWISSLTLWNLPSHLVDFNFLDKQKRIGNIIGMNSYNDVVSSLSVNDDFDVNINDVAIFNDSTLSVKNGQIIRGKSRIAGLQWPLSNIESYYRVRNLITNKRGAWGALVSDTGNNQSGMPMPWPKNTKEDLQAEFDNYGLEFDKHQVIITNAALKWVQIALPTKDLMLFDGIIKDHLQILDAYGIPIDVFSKEGGSKFDSKKEGKKAVITNTVQPEWETWYSNLNKFLKTKENGYLLEPDTSKIEVLQEDQSKAATKNKTVSEGINQVLTSYNSNQLSDVQAMSILVNIWGIDENKAKELLTKPKQDGTQN